LKREKLLAVLVFVVIQAVLLFDVTLHDPRFGYDADSHLKYAAVLAHGRLPVPSESYEFFSPPLPYTVVAIANAAGFKLEGLAAKTGQFANLLYSIGVCIFVLKICNSLSPGSYELQFWSLALLAFIPAYYKSFSMVRGEPLLCLFVTASVYYALRAYDLESRRRRRWDFVVLGVLLGLAVLCRQWGFLILPALVIYAVMLPAPNLVARMLNLRWLVLSFAIAALIGGWFYVRLHQRFGRVTAFNQTPHGWSLGKEPTQFYFGLGLDSLFTDPIRPEFANEFIPTFYSEFWGDYECYFLVYGMRPKSGDYISGFDLLHHLRLDPFAQSFYTNRFTIAPWLGLAQAAAIVPSMLFFAGFIMAMMALFGRGLATRADGLLALMVLTSMTGFLWFLVGFPTGSGNTIKATYMLQIVPLLAILGARMLLMIRDRSPGLYRIFLGLLPLSAILLAPFLFTRYVTIPW
jgi:hypothetical protein